MPVQDWQSDAEATIDAHLRAVAGRDLDTFAATVHPEVTVIIPSGRILRGAEEVVAFHREWFTDGDWTYATAPVLATSTATTATRVLEVTVVGEPGAEPSRFLMGLTFVAESGRWLLIHDQCTIGRPA
ncbi:ketosteroid isomerase-like protein [Actinokineospora baliensis]|uniref:YybH family protein n=1 Tax=Actinokineospora baliensis TaxID=547056 RepID=UPI001956EF5A|nr:nuclear transport factor 2 family protein [Actinokineospora baliensis]MBM7773630.1 ketosteroid isomerase-like protein [Actinokineospora baliensis]